MKKLIAFQVSQPQLDKLEKLVTVTGWNQSEVMRQLIDAAVVRSPQARVQVEVELQETAPEWTQP